MWFDAEYKSDVPHIAGYMCAMCKSNSFLLVTFLLDYILYTWTNVRYLWKVFWEFFSWDYLYPILYHKWNLSVATLPYTPYTEFNKFPSSVWNDTVYYISVITDLSKFMSDYCSWYYIIRFSTKIGEKRLKISLRRHILDIEQGIV